MWLDLWEWAQGVHLSLSYVKGHQGALTSEEALNNLQVDVCGCQLASFFGSPSASRIWPWTERPQGFSGRDIALQAQQEVSLYLPTANQSGTESKTESSLWHHSSRKLVSHLVVDGFYQTQSPKRSRNSSFYELTPSLCMELPSLPLGLGLAPMFHVPGAYMMSDIYFHGFTH